LSPSI
jgi:chromosome segregation ATPase